MGPTGISRTRFDVYLHCDNISLCLIPPPIGVRPFSVGATARWDVYTYRADGHSSKGSGLSCLPGVEKNVYLIPNPGSFVERAS